MTRSYIPSGLVYLDPREPDVVDPGADEDERRRNCARAIQGAVGCVATAIGVVIAFVLLRSPMDVIVGVVGTIVVVWLWSSGPDRHRVPRELLKDLARAPRPSSRQDRADLHRAIWAYADLAYLVDRAEPVGDEGRAAHVRLADLAERVHVLARQSTPEARELSSRMRSTVAPDGDGETA